jgi:glycosyltransferase involved in cell wall biosynthesis
MAGDDKANETREKKHRIFLGLTEIANIVGTYAKAFNQIGYGTYTVVNKKNPYYRSQHYDVVIAEKLKNISTDSFIKRLFFLSCQQLLLLFEFIKALLLCDIFIFVYGNSFTFPYYWDYPILKLFNKKIVSLFCGCDIRHWSSYEQELKMLGDNVQARSVCADCKDHASCCLTEKLRTVKYAERYSDRIISHPCLSQLLTRPYFRAYNPINLAEYPYEIPDNVVPVVVHAPTNREIKGTEYIIKAVEELREDGVNFEFKILEGVDNLEVRETLGKSDILVDTVLGYSSGIGMLAIEGMSTGNLVLSADSGDSDNITDGCPIVSVNPNNIGEELKRAVVDIEYRKSVAIKGRNFVEKRHGHLKVALDLISILDGRSQPDIIQIPYFAEKYFTIPAGLLAAEKGAMLQRLWRRLKV